MYKLIALLFVVMVMVGCASSNPDDLLLNPEGTTFNPGDLDSALINVGDPYSDAIAGDMSLPINGATFLDANDPRLAALDPALAAEAKTVLRDIHFAYNSPEILPNEARILEQIAVFMQRFPNATLEIEGHCDSRGTEEYNMALGSRRATSVREFLSDLGVSYNRLYIISFGEEQPISSAQNETAYAQNRRAHFKVGLTQ